MPVIGTIALPVMSPPMIRTSALWNAPAFRNFRQHTSEPWMSVAKKIASSAPPVVPTSSGSAYHCCALADPRAQLPARRLRGLVDGLPQRCDLARGSKRTGRSSPMSRSSGVKSVSRYWGSLSRLPVTVRHQPQSFEVMDRIRGRLIAPQALARVGRPVVLAERMLGEQDQRVEHVLAVDLDDLQLREEQLRDRQRRASTCASRSPNSMRWHISSLSTSTSTGRSRGIVDEVAPACCPNSALWRLSGV